MICSTVTISFLVAILVFGAIMHAFGPQRGVGQIFYRKKVGKYPESLESSRDKNIVNIMKKELGDVELDEEDV